MERQSNVCSAQRTVTWNISWDVYLTARLGRPSAMSVPTGMAWHLMVVASHANRTALVKRQVNVLAAYLEIILHQPRIVQLAGRNVIRAKVLQNAKV